MCVYAVVLNLTAQGKQNDEYNWKCGCAYDDHERCRPPPLTGEHAGQEIVLDCSPGVDCPEDEYKLKVRLRNPALFGRRGLTTTL